MIQADLENPDVEEDEGEEELEPEEEGEEEELPAVQLQLRERAAGCAGDPAPNANVGRLDLS